MKRVFMLFTGLIFFVMLTGTSFAKTVFVYAEDEVSNSSTLEASAMAISTNLKLTTYNNQCIEIRFSAEASSIGPNLSRQIQFWPTIDGLPVYPTAGGFGFVYWDAAENAAYDMASFTWFACGLNTGTHTVAIYYNPYTAGNTAYLRSTLLAIQFKKGKLIP